MCRPAMRAMRHAKVVSWQRRTDFFHQVREVRTRLQIAGLGSPW